MFKNIICEIMFSVFLVLVVAGSAWNGKDEFGVILKEKQFNLSEIQS